MKNGTAREAKGIHGGTGKTGETQGLGKTTISTTAVGGRAMSANKEGGPPARV